MLARASASLALCALLIAGCASDPPVFEEPPAAEDLYQEGLTVLQGRRILGIYRKVDYNRAIETFQAIVDSYPYSDYAVIAELKIADSYFDDERYEEALSYYRDFGDLHPQHEKVPYTIFRSGLCHERRMRSTNRDQTATRDALVYLDRLLATYPHSEYAEEAEVLWRDLRTRLAQSVMRIADFYRKRGEYESAAERYRSLLNEYPGLGLDPDALYRLGICYSNMNRQTEAGRIFEAIVQNYHDSDVAGDAEKRVASGE